MKSFLGLCLSFLFSTLVFAQATDVNVGSTSPSTTSLETNNAFTAAFPETNVGFLHVYADPAIDPLETYLMRGTEMPESIIAMLPRKFRKQASREGTTLYAVSAIRGINEDLYLMRTDAPGRDQIDMLALRKGKVKHLKTLAYRDCRRTECLQMDSYITDLNRDTDFDLVQIARRTTTKSGTTNERRVVYTMHDRKRKWKKTKLLEVPWEGITFFDPEQDQ